MVPLNAKILKKVVVQVDIVDLKVAILLGQTSDDFIRQRETFCRETVNEWFLREKIPVSHESNFINVTR